MKDEKKPQPNKFTGKRHLGAAIVRPFVEGAKVQLERYVEAQRLTKTYKTTLYINRCIYEASSLFEHLSTIAIYLEMLGVVLPIQQKVIDIRNHIRHDVREEFDNDTRRKEERAKRLGLNPKLQMGISFVDSGIKVGSTSLSASEMGGFIETAETCVNAMLLGVNVEVGKNKVEVGSTTINQ